MKQYTDHLSTPLKFHNFFRFVWIPLQAFTALGYALGMYMGGYAFEGYYVIDFAYYIAVCALMVLAFIGSLRFKDFFIWSVYTFMAAEIIYYVAVFIIGSIYSVASPTSSAMIFGAVIRNSLIYIYYKKRRLLFTKDGFNYKHAKAVQAQFIRDGGYVNTTRYNTNNGYVSTDAAHSTSCSTSCEVERGDNFLDEAMYIHRDVEDESRECPGCGHEVMAGDKFCVLCGTKL